MSRPLPSKALRLLFNARFDPAPKPINLTTFPATEVIIHDERHPLHTTMLRRIQAWSPNKLHWAVRAPINLSKKRTMRSWASRRFRDAFTDELKKLGFNKRGEPTLGTSKAPPLTGALSVTLLRPVLTAPIEDVREACRAILRKNVIGRKKS